MDVRNVEKTVVKQGFCCSCGTCKYICPNHNISFHRDPVTYEWTPSVLDTDKCLHCNADKNCLSVCPMCVKDYQAYGSDSANPFGAIHSLYTGFSTVRNLRHSASSGALVRCLCRHLLDQKLADGIVALKQYNGLEYNAHCYRTAEELKTMPNSIYHSVSFSRAIKLIKEFHGTLAIVALPCQLMGIEQFLEKPQNARYREKLILKIGLICGYSRPRENIFAYAALHHERLKDIQYRTGGRYRKTLLNGKFHDKAKMNRRQKLIDQMLLQDHFTVRKACAVCTNHLAFSADIAVGDAWLGKYRTDSLGSNIIVCRNEKADRFIKNLPDFKLYQETPAALIESQGREYACNAIAYAVTGYIEKSGSTVPNNSGNKSSYRLTRRDEFSLSRIPMLLHQRKYRKALLLYSMITKMR